MFFFLLMWFFAVDVFYFLLMFFFSVDFSLTVDVFCFLFMFFFLLMCVYVLNVLSGVKASSGCIAYVEKCM